MICIRCGKETRLISHNKDGTETRQCPCCNVFFVGSLNLWITADGDVVNEG